MLDFSEIIKQVEYAVQTSKDLQSLEMIHAQYLGRKGKKTQILKTKNQ